MVFICFKDELIKRASEDLDLNRKPKLKTTKPNDLFQYIEAWGLAWIPNFIRSFFTQERQKPTFLLYVTNKILKNYTIKKKQNSKLRKGWYLQGKAKRNVNVNAVVYEKRRCLASIFPFERARKNYLARERERERKVNALSTSFWSFLSYYPNRKILQKQRPWFSHQSQSPNFHAHIKNGP